MITYHQGSSLTELMLAHQVLRGIDAYYPEFDDWFINKCMPAVSSGKDRMILAEDHQRIVGVALVKNGEDEKKLRCVRVLPEYNGKGVAIHLIDRALRTLDCDKPATSVPEELLHAWSRILVNRFNFDLGHVAKGLYRPGHLEYFFNGERSNDHQVPETPYGRE